MSMSKNDYIIVGYDISNCPIMSSEDFHESKLYEDLTHNQSVGNIQIFDDPVSSKHMYFGYILDYTEGCYGDLGCRHPLCVLSDIGAKVYRKLISSFKSDKGISSLSVISFTEYR